MKVSLTGAEEDQMKFGSSYWFWNTSRGLTQNLKGTCGRAQVGEISALDTAGYRNPARCAIAVDVSHGC